MNRELIAGAKARELGLKRYYTGKPCPHGHDSERLVSNGCCVRCLHLASNKLAKKYPAVASARRKKWRKADPERFLANSRKHSELRKTLTQEWRKKNWQQARSNCINYTSKKRRASGRHSYKDIVKLFKRQQGRCLCSAALIFGYHVDHKTPLSRGGSNWPRNLQLLCETCNTSKGAKTMREWKQYAQVKN